MIEAERGNANFHDLDDLEGVELGLEERGDKRDRGREEEVEREREKEEEKKEQGERGVERPGRRKEKDYLRIEKEKRKALCFELRSSYLSAVEQQLIQCSIGKG
jgi:hypothetical protein